MDQRQWPCRGQHLLGQGQHLAALVGRNVFDLIANLQAGLGDGQTFVGIAQLIKGLYRQTQPIGGLWRGQQARCHGSWGKVNMLP